MSPQSQSERRAWLQNQIAMTEAQISTPGTGDMDRQARVLKDLQMQLSRLDDAEAVTSPVDLVEIVKGELNWTGLDFRIDGDRLVVTLKTSAMERLEKTFREVIFAQRADAMLSERRARSRKHQPGTMLGVEHM